MVSRWLRDPLIDTNRFVALCTIAPNFITSVYGAGRVSTESTDEFNLLIRGRQRFKMMLGDSWTAQLETVLKHNSTVLLANVTPESLAALRANCNSTESHSLLASDPSFVFAWHLMRHRPVSQRMEPTLRDDAQRAVVAWACLYAHEAPAVSAGVTSTSITALMSRRTRELFAHRCDDEALREPMTRLCDPVVLFARHFARLMPAPCEQSVRLRVEDHMQRVEGHLTLRSDWPDTMQTYIVLLEVAMQYNTPEPDRYGVYDVQLSRKSVAKCLRCVFRSGTQEKSDALLCVILYVAGHSTLTLDPDVKADCLRYLRAYSTEEGNAALQSIQTARTFDIQSWEAIALALADGAMLAGPGTVPPAPAQEGWGALMPRIEDACTAAITAAGGALTDEAATHMRGYYHTGDDCVAHGFPDAPGEYTCG